MYVDHFVWITSDLFREIERFNEQLGITPEYGGQHKGRGTHNALVKVSDGCYLELIAKDPAQTVAKPWIIANHSDRDGLIHWAWRTPDLEGQLKQCHRMGWTLGKVASGSRNRVDNSILEWKLTDPDFPRLTFEPFLIEWSSHHHPSDTLPEQCSLVSMEVRCSTTNEAPYFKFLPADVKVINDTSFAMAAIVIKTAKGIYRLQHGTCQFIKVNA